MGREDAIYNAVGGWLLDHPLSPPKVLKARDEAALSLAVD
jgi:hypothetical protein